MKPHRSLLASLLVASVLASTLSSCSTGEKDTITTTRRSCGTEGQPRVLVAYATRAGSTVGVAEAIGEELCKNGFRTDTVPVEDVKRLNAYQAVVLGSGIRVGKWYSEARDFIDDHLQELTRVPVAYFAVCASLMEDTPEKRKEASAYLQEPRAKLKPVDEGLFAGAIDYSKLSFFARMAGKMAKMPEGDYRNWSAIRQWAAGLKQKFQPAQ